MQKGDDNLYYFISGLVGYRNGSLNTWLLDTTNRINNLDGSLTKFNETSLKHTKDLDDHETELKNLEIDIKSAN
jgi:hypothetical protein